MGLMISQELRALIRLSRFREYTVQAALLGLFAVRLAGGSWDGKVLAVLIANQVGLLYVYMLNDVEDAPDDALDPSKRVRNPIASGELSRMQGYSACSIAATLAVVLYAALGPTSFALGTAMLVIATIGTTRTFRLKGRFIIDVLWHGFVIGTAQFLIAFLSFSAAPNLAFWPSLVAVILFSMYIELWQEVRDLDIDYRAGLRTSAFVLGRRRVQQIASFIILTVCSLLLWALIARGIPVWFLGVWGIIYGSPYVYRILTLHPKSLLELVKGSHNRTVLVTAIGLIVWFAIDV